MGNKKRSISFILVLTLFITSFSLNVGASKIDTSEVPEDFLGYMDGVLVTKSDVNENGMIINEEKLQLMEENYNNNLSVSRASNATVRKGQNAFVESYVSAPRYGQTNYHHYFTPKAGRDFASEVDVSSKESIAWFIAGLVKAPYSIVVGSAGLIAGLQRSTLASKIRSYTDDDKSLRVTVATSGYGTFYGVHNWNGTNVQFSFSSSEELVNWYKY